VDQVFSSSQRHINPFSFSRFIQCNCCKPNTFGLSVLDSFTLNSAFYIYSSQIPSTTTLQKQLNHPPIMSSINKIKGKVVRSSTLSGQHLATILPSKGSALQITHGPTPTLGPNDLLVEVKIHRAQPDRLEAARLRLRHRLLPRDLRLRYRGHRRLRRLLRAGRRS